MDEQSDRHHPDGPEILQQRSHRRREAEHVRTSPRFFHPKLGLGID